MQTRLYTGLRAAALPELLAEFAAAVESTESRARELRLKILIVAIAERDPNAALEAVVQHTFDRRISHSLGLALLDGAGVTHDNVVATMAVLPRLDRVRFVGGAAAALAAESPPDALAFARTFEAKLERMSALEAVADVVAERDPYSALALADTIPAEPGVIFRPDRRVFQMAALRHLARASFITATEYVAGEIRTMASQRARTDLLEVLREEAELVDPRLALEAVRQLDIEGARSIESAAIERLARDNPLDAFAYVDNITGFGQRARLRQQIARIYGEIDPEAALAWVSSSDGATARLLSNVLQGVARKDPLRALNVILSAGPSNYNVSVRMGPATFMSNQSFDVLGTVFGPSAESPPGLSRDELIAAIGERLLAIRDGPDRQSWLNRFVMGWSQNDPVAVLRWANEHTGVVQPWMYSNIAERFRGDPDAAMQHIDLVPENMRSPWIRSVATALARRDSGAAAEWIAQYRNRPEYSRLAAAVAAAAVRTDSANALQLLATLPLEAQIDASQNVAAQWAVTDPVAARGWVETLAPGAQRDSAIKGLLLASMAFNPNNLAIALPEPTLLALFSSDATRQQAIFENAQQLAYRNPDAARKLVETYLTDPALLARAEARITNMERRR